MLVSKYLIGKCFLVAILVLITVGASVLSFSPARATFNHGIGEPVAENMCPKSCRDNDRKTHDLFNNLILMLLVPTILAIAGVAVLAKKIQSKKRRRIIVFIAIIIILLPTTYAALGHTVVDCSYLRGGYCAVEY
jgi:cytochrome bd-type quinol oxidase subunit 2